MDTFHIIFTNSNNAEEQFIIPNAFYPQAKLLPPSVTLQGQATMMRKLIGFLSQPDKDYAVFVKQCSWAEIRDLYKISLILQMEELSTALAERCAHVLRQHDCTSQQAQEIAKVFA